MDLFFQLNDEEHRVGLASRKPDLRLYVDGRVHCVSEVISKSNHQVELTIDGHVYNIWHALGDDHSHLKIGGRTFSLKYKDPLQVAQQGSDSNDVLKADMPGVVVNVSSEIENPVRVGDLLMVIESMKMQINIIAPRDGIVDVVHVGVDDTFEKGADLISLRVEN
jgi:acetyl/propionyl-CoA carboxylase alpha subunit